jgi:hypothetical protein
MLTIAISVQACYVFGAFVRPAQPSAGWDDGAAARRSVLTFDVQAQRRRIRGARLDGRERSGSACRLKLHDWRIISGRSGDKNPFFTKQVLSSLFYDERGVVLAQTLVHARIPSVAQASCAVNASAAG